MIARQYPSASEAQASPSSSQASRCWVTFASSGGSSVAPAEVQPGHHVPQPAAPTRTGYTFAGWYADPALATPWDFAADYAGGDNLTVYAAWTPITYTVTYYLNGGTNSPDNPETYTIEDADILLATPTRAGYAFDGWYADTAYATAKPTIPTGSTGNITVYAKWSLITYDIAYHLNGGTNGNNPTTYTVITPTITLAAPSRLGYTFGGWYTDAEFTTPAVNIPVGSTGPREYYAKWTVNTYTITYTPNGGSGGMTPTSYTIEDATITLGAPERTGYTFAGWFRDSEFLGAVVTQIPAGSTGNLALYAKWTLNVYPITYHLNGGINSTFNQPDYAIMSSTLHLYPATREGYDFAGWFAAPDFSGQAVASIPAGSHGDVDLYAKWTVIEYQIYYTLSGGTNSPENPATYTIEDADILLEPPTRERDSFVAWYDNAGFFGTPTPGIPAGSTGNRSFYARWIAFTAPTAKETIDRYGGDPKITITENGADLDYQGGQPVMEQGVDNVALISLFTKPGWPGNIFLPPENRIGSDYEDTTSGTITLSKLADIANSAERALTSATFPEVQAEVSNPTGDHLSVDIRVSPGPALSLTREGALWKAQKAKGAGK
ncbi:InlB B-repeat-containing protein [Treponema primitia]|uniref:InlB B-repeat-containing protein n=1 Tax=Treponema primitia TaxID=88058 RepID=UPI003980E1CF